MEQRKRQVARYVARTAIIEVLLAVPVSIPQGVLLEALAAIHHARPLALRRVDADLHSLALNVLRSL